MLALCDQYLRSAVTMNQSNFLISKDTPVGLPSKVAKLGAYSGSNPSRDFRRVFKPPVDRDSKLFVGKCRFKC